MIPAPHTCATIRIQDLVKALTDCIYPIAECPKEHVHAHVMHSQVVSFGSGDCETICCHTRVVHAQELSREKKDQMAGGIQAALAKALPSMNPGRTQVCKTFYPACIARLCCSDGGILRAVRAPHAVCIELNPAPPFRCSSKAPLPPTSLLGAPCFLCRGARATM